MEKLDSIALASTGRFSPYLPVIVLYFFFNSVLLPHGLLYTVLLSPIFMIWLRGHGQSLHWNWFVGVFTTLFAIHWFSQDIILKDYLKSAVLLISSYIFCLSSAHLLRLNLNWDRVFKQVLLINALFVGVALLTLAIPALQGWLWYLEPISPGIPALPRLKLLTYEASYYSLLMVPVATYWLMKSILTPNGRIANVLIWAWVPLILSFSLGVLGGIAIALILVLLVYANRLLRFRRIAYLALLILAITLCLLIALQLLWPDNPLTHRAFNIIEGRDTSARGRTFESFMLAWEIAKQKGWLFGAGLGQIKHIGRDLIINFYKYQGHLVEVVRIPNSMAEWLAIYGVFGFVGKLALEGAFFFKTKVYANYYRLTLFIFIFIYQFTGSFIFNVAEYAIWVMAFSPKAFEWFNIDRFRLSSTHTES